MLIKIVSRFAKAERRPGSDRNELFHFLPRVDGTLQLRVIVDSLISSVVRHRFSSGCPQEGPGMDRMAGIAPSG
jgi:hypothetical protein